MPCAAADEAIAGRCLAFVLLGRTPATRPGHQPEQPVDEDGAGSATQCARRADEHHPHALTEEPHPEGPEERRHQRRAHRAPEEQADPDEELNGGEQRVPHRRRSGR